MFLERSTVRPAPSTARPEPSTARPPRTTPTTARPPRPTVGTSNTTTEAVTTTDDYDYSGGVDPITPSLVGDEDYIDYQY